MDDQEVQKFEPLLSKLRSIVEQLESEDIDLEQSLKAYEEGIALARRAQSFLEDAEQRVYVLEEPATEAESGQEK